MPGIKDIVAENKKEAEEEADLDAEYLGRSDDNAVMHFKNDKPDFTDELERHAKLNDTVVLNTWVRRAVVGRIISVNKAARIFRFYSVVSKQVNTYGINIVRGIEPIGKTYDAHKSEK